MYRFARYAAALSVCVSLIALFGYAVRADAPQVASGTWAASGEFGTIPPGAASVALADGRVLVAGGRTGDTLSRAIATYDRRLAPGSPPGNSRQRARRPCRDHVD